MAGRFGIRHEASLAGSAAVSRQRTAMGATELNRIESTLAAVDRIVLAAT